MLLANLIRFFLFFWSFRFLSFVRNRGFGPLFFRSANQEEILHHPPNPQLKGFGIVNHFLEFSGPGKNPESRGEVSSGRGVGTIM